MKLTLALSVSADALSASTWPVGVAASREERSLGEVYTDKEDNKNNDKNNWKNQQTYTTTQVTSGDNKYWSTTDDCNCWE